jgi:hypothetical protein
MKWRRWVCPKMTVVTGVMHFGQRWMTAKKYVRLSVPKNYTPRWYLESRQVLRNPSLASEAGKMVKSGGLDFEWSSSTVSSSFYVCDRCGAMLAIKGIEKHASWHNLLSRFGMEGDD